MRAFEIPADVAALARARREMAAALDGLGWDEQDAGRILLAGSEALSNAIEHGSPEAGAVAIAIESSGDRFVVRIRDQGRPGGTIPTPPSREPPPDHIRGRGLLIMSRLADAVTFRPGGAGGTEVTLTFRAASTLLRPLAAPA